MKKEKIISDFDWGEFVSNTWQKECLVMVSDFDVDLLSQHRVLQILLSSCESWIEHRGKGDEGYASLRWFLDGVPIDVEVMEKLGLFPELSDNSSSSYMHRVGIGLNKKKPGLIDRVFRKSSETKLCNLVLDQPNPPPDLRDQIYGLLRKVYCRLGYIAPGSFIFFIFGEYRSTPFGIHRHDSEGECDGTFAVTYNGQKNIWVWPEEYQIDHPEIVQNRNIERFASQGTKLSAEPGEMIYITSHHWHVGEAKSKSDLSMFVAIEPEADICWRLLVFFRTALPQMVPTESLKASREALHEVMRRYKKRTGHMKIRERPITRISLESPDLQVCAQQIPAEIIEASELLSEAFSAEIIADLMQLYWLGTLSSFGFSPAAKEIDRPQLHKDQKVETLDNHPVIYASRDQSTVLAAGGQAWRCDLPSRAVGAMIDCLADEQAVSIEYLTSTAIDHLSSEELSSYGESHFLGVLSKLNNLGALRVDGVLTVSM